MGDYFSSPLDASSIFMIPYRIEFFKIYRLRRNKGRHDLFEHVFVLFCSPKSHGKVEQLQHRIAPSISTSRSTLINCVIINLCYAVPLRLYHSSLAVPWKLFSPLFPKTFFAHLINAPTEISRRRFLITTEVENKKICRQKEKTDREEKSCMKKANTTTHVV